MAPVVKNPPANAGDIRDTGSVSGLGRSPGEGHGNPLQYSCLGNPMDRGAWWATVHGVARSQTRLKWLNMHTCIYPTEWDYFPQHLYRFPLTSNAPGFQFSASLPSLAVCLSHFCKTFPLWIQNDRLALFPFCSLVMFFHFLLALSVSSEKSVDTLLSPLSLRFVLSLSLLLKFFLYH